MYSKLGVCVSHTFSISINHMIHFMINMVITQLVCNVLGTGNMVYVNMLTCILDAFIQFFKPQQLSTIVKT